MTVSLQCPETITIAQLIKLLERITADGAEVDWQEFLSWLELFCQYQGWDVEYDLASDRSCAIFADDGSTS